MKAIFMILSTKTKQYIESQIRRYVYKIRNKNRYSKSIQDFWKEVRKNRTMNNRFKKEQYNKTYVGCVRNKKGRTRLGTSNEKHRQLSQPGTCKKLGVYLRTKNIRTRTINKMHNIRNNKKLIRYQEQK